jgi:hypothetical protein
MPVPAAVREMAQKSMIPRMRMRSAARQLVIALLVLPFAFGSVLAEQLESTSVAELSPDRRPTLIVLPPLQGLMLAHHAHPLSQSRAEALAHALGLIVALPIIHNRARESLLPLPRLWTTDDADRGFMERLSAALEPGEANWPWRSLSLVKSGEEIDRLIGQLSGDDVAVALLGFELEDLGSYVQLGVQADLTFVRSTGTARESRVRTVIRHLAPRLPADPQRPRRSAGEFSAGGALDRLMGTAALDLSRALAVTIARDLTAGPPSPDDQGRRYASLGHKPKCRECSPNDLVLHEEPGRVWVVPAKLPGTILSLPTVDALPPG